MLVNKHCLTRLHVECTATSSGDQSQEDRETEESIYGFSQYEFNRVPKALHKQS